MINLKKLFLAVNFMCGSIFVTNASQIEKDQDTGFIMLFNYRGESGDTKINHRIKMFEEFKKLPDELKIHVFSFTSLKILPKIRLGCRYFNDLIKEHENFLYSNSRLWNNSLLVIRQTEDKPSTLDDFLKSKPSLKGIQFLSLVHVRKWDLESFNILYSYSNLQRINFSDCSLGNAGTQFLSSLTTLTKMSIDNDHISEFNFLKPLSRLTALSLCACQIDDQAVAEIATFTNLKSLTFINHNITPVGSEELRSLTNLKKLTIVNY